ncbi:hypothetical protein BKA82DRAFT_995392 [Pisolithus tinctorius]|uniref:Uncharacterized protein n=1 Tax=Pisolithus tinctorius Marx 270 TaxID=870435 RepID=A0A0C3PPU3_PISTI|nr:hypothetical protein BKA82DRAFT_995392 [Pisolithus tinctorius]KIO10961.1 hypothetical protein M404DRAFT_995392 [Pisolithus tinctorius Marx 270]
MLKTSRQAAICPSVSSTGCAHVYGHCTGTTRCFWLCILGDRRLCPTKRKIAYVRTQRGGIDGYRIATVGLIGQVKEVHIRGMMDTPW